MKSNKERSSRDIPDGVIQSIMEHLWHYTVGFVRVESAGKAHEVILLGSGVLVSVNGVQAILTADHVIDVLPRAGRLGLALSYKVEQTTIDVAGVNYTRIARGEDPQAGPDIGAVILSPTIGAAISSRKSFYNLTIRKDQLLNQLPDDREGIWITNGFVEELTLSDSTHSTYEQVKAFCQFGAVGGVEGYTVEGEHDYYSFPLVYGQNYSIPNNFGGTSGDGLWHVPLIATKDGELKGGPRLLQGLAFYQQPFEQDRSGLRCHGPKSIYNVAYTTMGQHAP